MKTQLLLLILFFWLSALGSLSFPKVDTDLQEYDENVATLRTNFAKIPANIQDKEWVKKKLTHMVEVDQYMRRFPDVIYTHE